jgi:dihydroorotate dehydrogenase electron transfer subunit
MPYADALILERREAGALTRLTLLAPELARAARPGQLALVRPAPPGSADPLLRRPLFFADADPAAGTLELLLAPEERGMAWIAAQPAGAQLDLFGPVGTGFTLDTRTRNLLLAGAGPALAALIFLARQAVARQTAVVLLVAAAAENLLPPPFLLPPDVEYQASESGEDGLPALLGGTGRSSVPALAGSLVAWADQIALALSDSMVQPVSDAVRAGRMRWERGFAHVALAGPLPCGVGTCLSCPVATRDAVRLRCKDGPVFDLRDLRR